MRCGPGLSSFASESWRPRALAILLTFTLLCGASACKEPGPVVVMHGDGESVRVRVELALTAQDQARGLMWRETLDRDAGMLFVFGRSRERTFWMKNTIVPLDIIYIGADSRVISVAEKTTPYSVAPIPSRGPAKYVLEVNAGFARAHGIGAGARVELPALDASERPAA